MVNFLIIVYRVSQKPWWLLVWKTPQRYWMQTCFLFSQGGKHYVPTHHLSRVSSRSWPWAPKTSSGKSLKQNPPQRWASPVSSAGSCTSCSTSFYLWMWLCLCKYRHCILLYYRLLERFIFRNDTIILYQRWSVYRTHAVFQQLHDFHPVEA